jgi:hypothetical protein
MDLANEVLRGAKNIALELYNKDDKKHLRKIYHKHETGQLPTWKEGQELVTTRTALRNHYQAPNQKGGAEHAA